MPTFKLHMLAALAALTMITGCSITHRVADDYAEYLANNYGSTQFQKVKVGNQYFLPDATQNHRYEFRSATVGHAHLWVVEFGKVLDATMQSQDVVEAFGVLDKANAAMPDVGSTILFDLQKYTFEDFGAHIELTISIKNSKSEIFRKSYQADGISQGGKMFWGGPFAMKNAIHQSTKQALDQIINNFIQDAKSVH